MPTLYLTIALGFAFSKPFENQFLGYLFGLSFIWMGMNCGATSAFLLSKLQTLRDHTNRQVFVWEAVKEAMFPSSLKFHCS